MAWLLVLIAPPVYDYPAPQQIFDTRFQAIIVATDFCVVPIVFGLFVMPGKGPCCHDFLEGMFRAEICPFSTVLILAGVDATPLFFWKFYLFIKPIFDALVGLPSNPKLKCAVYWSFLNILFCWLATPSSPVRKNVGCNLFYVDFETPFTPKSKWCPLRQFFKSLFQELLTSLPI